MPYKSRHIYDLKPSPIDARDRIYSVDFGATVPPAADLDTAMPPIKEQSREESCTGFSLSSAREALWLANGNPYIAFSPAWIYWQERVIEHDTDQDPGACIRDGLEVLVNVGVCPEADMPYIAGNFGSAPPDAAVQSADRYKAPAYHRLTGLTGIKQALSTKRPVVLGISVYSSFETVGSDGMAPMPAPSEELLGGHAILAVGYKDDPNVPGAGLLTLNNSWGEKAGDRGRFYVPYDYVRNPNYTTEYWTLP